MSRPGLSLSAALACALLAGFSCAGGEEGATKAGAVGPFQDVARKVGLDFVMTFGRPEKPLILESTGTGVCWTDVDGDGWLDLYVVNGSSLAILRGEEPTVRNRLYRNGGDGTFEDVTEAARVGDPGWGQGCAFADYDNDGDPDLYVTNFGANVLYRNRGDGTFEVVTEAAGVGDSGWGTGIAWGDYDRDGWLDLYVANYVDLDPFDPPQGGKSCYWSGIPVFCGPAGLKGAQDRLYRNQGDGTFREVGEQVGIPREEYYGFQATFTDLDGDGWPDLYVADDSTPNLLLQNRGDGTFVDRSVESGTAYSEDGREQAGMGVAVGDYNADGLFDIFVTNLSHDNYALYRNGGGLFFADLSYPDGVGHATYRYLGWGTAFVDLDHDGDQDLVVANGHIYPQVKELYLGTDYDEPNQVFRNDRGRFVEVTGEAGPGFAQVRSSRGLAAADYDHDGDLDLAITNIDGPLTLLRREGRLTGHWLQLVLRGTRSNRDGIGARVTVAAGGRSVVAERRSGESYLSQHSPRLHFGLGTASRVERLEIRWPSGEVQTLTDLPADQILVVTQGDPTPRLLEA